MVNETVTPEGAESADPGPLNPAALTVAQAARLLAAASGREVTAAMVQSAIEAGAPVVSTGRVHLVDLMAWLEREIAPGR